MCYITSKVPSYNNMPKQQKNNNNRNDESNSCKIWRNQQIGMRDGSWKRD